GCRSAYRRTQGRRKAVAHSRGPAHNVFEVNQPPRRPADQLQRSPAEGRHQTHSAVILTTEDADRTDTEITLSSALPSSLCPLCPRCFKSLDSMPEPSPKAVEALFKQAIDLDPPQRAAFLDEHCGANAELRAAVDELLQLDSKAQTD